MAELKLKNGDYIGEGGRLRRAEGSEALLERVLFRLTARRGRFPFLPELGSRLWQLGQISPGRREIMARQYAAEALAEEDVTVEDAQLLFLAEGVMRLRLELRHRGTLLETAVDIR